MCGRIASYLPPEAIAALFRTKNEQPNVSPEWNLAPGQDALVVRRHPETGERHLGILVWGFLPYWTKGPRQARRPINAKSETVATSGMFRDAFARRRCIVPAAAFYEWKPIEGGRQKQPFAIARRDGKPLALAVGFIKMQDAERRKIPTAVVHRLRVEIDPFSQNDRLEIA